MAMQTFKMYITVGVGKWNHGEVGLSAYKPADDADSSFIRRLLDEVEIEVEVPDFDLVSIEVDALEKSIQKERADSQVRVNILLDRLSKLKAIGHDAPVNA